MSLCYGLERPTGDIDVIEVIPNEATAGLTTIAERGSSRREHKLYLQIVTVASLPYSYEDRLRNLRFMIAGILRPSRPECAVSAGIWLS